MAGLGTIIITGGTIIITGVSLVTVTAAIVERKLVRRGDGSAAALSLIVKGALIVGAMIAVGWFALNDPLVRL